MRGNRGARPARTLLLAVSMVVAALTIVQSAPSGADDDPVEVIGHDDDGWKGTGGVPQPAHDPRGPCDLGGLGVDGCSETEVRVNLDPSYWRKLGGALQVRLCTTGCSAERQLADFDLYVYQDGAPIGASAARPSNADEVVNIGSPSGTYVVRVVTAAFATAGLPVYEVQVSIGEGVKFAAMGMGLDCFTAKTWLSSDDWQSPVPEIRDASAISFDSCSGFVRRGDEPPLYINLSLPAGARQPLPTIALLHGWTGTGGDWRPVTADGCYDNQGSVDCPVGSYHYNSPWFVTQGYAAISYSARGHGSSCGYDQDPAAPPEECTRGWTQVAQRSAEAADTQHLLSVVVDAGIAHPDRLGATGGSYGGGQAWQLATALPWKTPGGRTLQLAAAAPTHGWTSFQNSLAPNGRASDEVTQTPEALDLPYGVVKRGFVSELLLGGRKGSRVDPLCGPTTPACPRRFVRFNDTEPGELHSYVAGWQAFWEAGEPYDRVGNAYTAAFRGKSAYHAEDYLAAVADRTVRPVPIFAVGGWTDSLFPAVETLQMYRRLKQAHPGYPIWMVLDDTGHGRPGDQAPEAHVRLANDRRTAFFDRQLRDDDIDLGPKVVSLRSSCHNDPVDTGGVSGPSWDAIRGREITLSPSLTWAPRSTAHAGRTAEAGGAKGDPFGLACATADAPAPGAASWTWPAPPGGTMLLGLPTVSVDYQLTGVDATLVAKLWDVAPLGGPRTLVTRGVYRLIGAPPGSRGQVSFQLYGNHWQVPDGHHIELELTQSDAPMFQADNLPSSLLLSSPSVSLPTPRPG